LIAGAAEPSALPLPLGPDLYQLLVRHLGEARNQRHAEMLAAIVQACRAEVLAAIADVRRRLRFLGLH
jgi:hypothetical protein